MSELRYDPFDPSIDRGVHAIWRRMRDEAPLYRNEEHDFWARTRYDDVLAGLLDVGTYSSAYGTTLDLMTDEPFPLPMFIFRDPPEHGLLRKLVSRAFTPRAIGGLAERIDAVCHELLDPTKDLSRVEFVSTFSALLPPTVILSLLGFPDGHAADMRASVDSTMAIDDDIATGSSRERLNRGEGLDAVVMGLIPEACEERRRNPGDDLLSVLATHERELPDGSRRPLTDDEVFAYVALISGAGSETVARMLSWAAVLLARHPDQRDLLLDDPSLIDNAVEEILRYEAPSPVQGRRVTADVEWHGETVPAGANLLLVNGSGNRDERHFPDPDRFDVRREIDRHLSFGYGAHFCIGAALARLEGAIGLRHMLRRFGRWEIDESTVDWVRTSTVRGPASVPLTAG